MHVLLADADERFLEIAQAYLSEQGHTPVAAMGGLECLTLLHDFTPEIVVLDHDLLFWGGCDGVLSYMSRHANLSRIPAIVTLDSGLPVKFDRSLCSQVAGWLHRPFKLPDLLLHINLVGRRARYQRSLSAAC